MNLAIILQDSKENFQRIDREVTERRTAERPFGRGVGSQLNVNGIRGPLHRFTIPSARPKIS